ncbi:MAG: NlpC/P60 family protein [Frankiaceae bacterium]
MPALRVRGLPRRLAVAAGAAGLVLTGVSVSAPAPAMAATASTSAATAIDFGLAQLGKPYRWGATGPSAYDCSGFTQAAYRAAGITIPRVSRYQYAALPKVGRHYWRPGDLIFFARDASRPSTIHHVAIFMGDGWMMDAPHDGTVVQVRPLYYRGLMWRAARPGGSTNRALLDIASATTGSQVKALQKRLRANGYGLSVTGAFDTATAKAVTSMRSRYDLPASTTIGWKFWHAVVAHGTHARSS